MYERQQLAVAASTVTAELTMLPVVRYDMFSVSSTSTARLKAKKHNAATCAHPVSLEVPTRSHLRRTYGFRYLQYRRLCNFNRP